MNCRYQTVKKKDLVKNKIYTEFFEKTGLLVQAIFIELKANESAIFEFINVSDKITKQILNGVHGYPYSLELVEDYLDEGSSISTTDTTKESEDDLTI